MSEKNADLSLPLQDRLAFVRTLFERECQSCGGGCSDDGVWLICMECGRGWRRTIRGIVTAEEWITERAPA